MSQWHLPQCQSSLNKKIYLRGKLTSIYWALNVLFFENRDIGQTPISFNLKATYYNTIICGFISFINNNHMVAKEDPMSWLRSALYKHLGWINVPAVNYVKWEL